MKVKLKAIIDFLLTVIIWTILFGIVGIVGVCMFIDNKYAIVCITSALFIACVEKIVNMITKQKDEREEE